MKIQRNIVIAMIVLGTIGFSGTVLGAPGKEVITTYYNDSAKTQVVGFRILPCNGGLQTTGQQTPYYTKTSTSCSRGAGGSKGPGAPCEFRANNTDCLNLPTKRPYQ